MNNSNTANLEFRSQCRIFRFGNNEYFQPHIGMPHFHIAKQTQNTNTTDSSPGEAGRGGNPLSVRHETETNTNTFVPKQGEGVGGAKTLSAGIKLK